MLDTTSTENRKIITVIIEKRLFTSLLVLLMSISLSAGKLSGVFSVGEDKYVHFSPGNLQYNAAKGTHRCADGTTQQGTWRFAEHQWDYVGDAELGNVYERGSKCSNALVSSTYDGWIDLFGWGTSGWNSGANEYQPWATSDENADYTPGGDENNDLTGSFAFADWSVYNQIGDDAPDTWRTMTKDEWVYLFRERENAEKLFGLGTVNGVPGTIILPDEWVTPTDLTFTPSTEKGFIWQDDTHYSSSNKRYTDNIYTFAQWEHMESAGAVFLPAAGYRHQDSSSNYVTVHGNYWTSTHASKNGSYYLRFAPDYLYTHFYYNRKRGFCVRPVKDSVVTPTYVPKPFSVSAEKQVTFSPGNLQYNATKGTHECADGTTQQGTWRFAEHQWDMVGMGYGQTEGDVNTSPYNTIGGTVTDGDNRNVSETYNGWIDLFGWGTSGWDNTASDPYAVNYNPWSISTTTVNSTYNYYGYGPSTNQTDMNLTGMSANYDWGVYNQIGNDSPRTWRTLTQAEWSYLLNTRTDASSKYGAAKVNGVIGVVILPDDWTNPPTGCGFTPGMTSAGSWYDWSLVAGTNNYTLAQWEKMEAAGAVFLPASGYRNGTDVSYVGTYGR